MAVFVIVDIDVTDPVRYEDYKAQAAHTVTAHGGRYVVRGGQVDTLEGDWRPGRVVVLEFPSADQARAWWNSETYRPAKAIRHATAKTDMILVECLDR